MLQPLCGEIKIFNDNVLHIQFSAILFSVFSPFSLVRL